jgi:hypothetical protein
VKRRFAFLLLFLFGCRGELESGAEEWASGQQKEATARWEKVASDGSASASIWYNLGNARYAAGDRSRAIAAWRAARWLDPRDSDATHNLALVRGETEGLPDPAGPTWGYTQFVRPEELAMVAAMLLGASSVFAWRRHRSGEPPISAVVGAIFVAGTSTAALAIGALRDFAEHPPAVVVDHRIPLRETPAVEAVTQGELLPGTEVRVESTLGEFARVTVGDGRRGFVAVESLVFVRP